jgi:hypothetical protein
MAKTTEDIFPVLLVGLLLYPLLAFGLGSDKRPLHITCEYIGTYNSDAATRHYDLAAFSTFKNEADVMEEWLEHHIWQGVQHFFLLENNSTDHIDSVIKPYIDAGRVTLCRTPSKAPQLQGLNHMRKLFAEKCTWCMQIDVDEFMFSVVPGMSLKDLIHSRYTPNNSVNIVYAVWYMFGSSGLKTQPACVRSSFTKRQQYFDNDPMRRKYIVRGKCLSKFGIHEAEMSGCKDTGTGKPDQTMGTLAYVLNPPEIKIFHYRVMSEERFRRVKMTRGSAADPAQDTGFRTFGYFQAYDLNSVDDTTLKDLLGPFGCYPVRQSNFHSVD